MYFPPLHDLSVLSSTVATVLRDKQTWEKHNVDGRDSFSMLQESIQIKANKMPQHIRTHKSKTSAASTIYSSSLLHHRSCSLFCDAYFLAAKPWNQSGKFPLLRMSGACVSVNHLSTSSFRPPSDVSMWRSTPDFFSILTRSSGADRAVVTQHAYSLLVTFHSQKEDEVPHLTISAGRLFRLNSGIVSVYLLMTLPPLIGLLFHFTICVPCPRLNFNSLVFILFVFNLVWGTSFSHYVNRRGVYLCVYLYWSRGGDKNVIPTR